MKVAIVYDRVNKYGGAERILEALHGIWPEAPLYTAVYDPDRAPWARDFDVRPSGLNRMPGARSMHELYAWATPLAFESFRFDGYDVVISVTSAEAKNIITKPGTVHVCYLLTPTRYLWSGYLEYLKNPGFGFLNPVVRRAFRAAVSSLRHTDLLASRRPDHYIAISQTVADRCMKYYGFNPEEVIYPPVDIEVFSPGRGSKPPDFSGPPGYFLFISRLVAYKRADLLISAFNRMKKPLVVIGSGREYQTLRRTAGPYIRFVSRNLTENELVYYYNHCRAFVFAGEEDFGLVAAEAQACGKPVIAFGKGGVAEIVRDGETGILFPEQTVASLVRAVERFSVMKFPQETCRENARRFSVPAFTERIKSFVTRHASIASAADNL